MPFPKEDGALPGACAVDTTVLLCGSSVLLPTEASGRRERPIEREKALRTVLTYYCNNRPIHYIRPKASEIYQGFPLLDLLIPPSDEDVSSRISSFAPSLQPRTLPPSPSSAPRAIPALSQVRMDEFSAEGDGCAWAGAAADFAKCVSDPDLIPHIIEWTLFQLDDDILASVFFEGGQARQIERLVHARTHLLAAPSYAQLRTRWHDTGIGKTLALPADHATVMKASFKDAIEYSLVYAFFGFAKGQFYGSPK